MTGRAALRLHGGSPVCWRCHVSIPYPALLFYSHPTQSQMRWLKVASKFHKLIGKQTQTLKKSQLDFTLNWAVTCEDTCKGSSHQVHVNRWDSRSCCCPHTSGEGLGPPTPPGQPGSEVPGTATNLLHRWASRSKTHSSCSGSAQIPTQCPQALLPGPYCLGLYSYNLK